MNRGFTLIELLVTSGIIILLTGGIFAGYNNFNRSQQLRQEALNLKTSLRLIQSNAINGVDPAVSPFCTSNASIFAGYLVDFSGTGYISYGICADGTPIPSTTKQKTYSSGIVDIVTTSRQRTFEPLAGKINTDITITLKSTNNSCYTVSVETGGNINDASITCP